MQNLIYQRASLDWGNIKNISQFLKANEKSRPLLKHWLPLLEEAIVMWDKIFRINYFEFRNEIKKISNKNVKSISNAKTISEESIHDLHKNYDDFLIYMIDDDDFMCPQLFNKIKKAYKKDDDFYVWPFGILEEKLRIEGPEILYQNIKNAYSNNCILTKKGFEKLTLYEKPKIFLEDHRRMDVLLHHYNFQYKKISHPLSVYNHSPGSATKLWNAIKNKENLYNILKKYTIIPNVPTSLNWFSPYLKEIWFFINILLKKTFI